MNRTPRRYQPSGEVRGGEGEGEERRGEDQAFSCVMPGLSLVPRLLKIENSFQFLLLHAGANSNSVSLQTPCMKASKGVP